jgi:hypothetical protein
VRASLPGNAQSVENLEVPVVEEEEAEGEDEWYEVPVHKVTVRYRQKGVTHSFFVPEVSEWRFGSDCERWKLVELDLFCRVPSS